MYGVPVGAAGHYGFDGLPCCYRAERQAVGATSPDGAGEPPISFGHEFHRSELDRCQMIGTLGIGQSVDMGLPPSRAHRYPQMVERSATTDHCFPCEVVGVQYSTWIEKQPQLSAIEHPLPGLAVV